MSARALSRFVPLLLLAAAAGCGGSAPTATEATPRLPRALARPWASRADAIGRAAAAGDGCRAQRLARSLRDDVIAKGDRVPVVYRGTLLSTVNRLADEIACSPPVQTVTTVTTAPAPPGPRPQPPGHDHGHHGHHGHGHGHGHGKGKGHHGRGDEG